MQQLLRVTLRSEPVSMRVGQLYLDRRPEEKGMANDTM
jgi:hypothetical protein